MAATRVTKVTDMKEVKVSQGVMANAVISKNESKLKNVAHFNNDSDLTLMLAE